MASILFFFSISRRWSKPCQPQLHTFMGPDMDTCKMTASQANCSTTIINPLQNLHTYTLISVFWLEIIHLFRKYFKHKCIHLFIVTKQLVHLNVNVNSYPVEKVEKYTNVASVLVYLVFVLSSYFVYLQSLKLQGIFCVLFLLKMYISNLMGKTIQWKFKSTNPNADVLNAHFPHHKPFHCPPTTVSVWPQNNYNSWLKQASTFNQFH